MAYKVYLNNTNLIFDSSIQDDSILFSKAIVDIDAQGAGSFDFTVPPCHKCYGQFNRLKDYIDVYRDSELIWSGRIYSITDTMDGQQSISCEGLLTMLADTVYIPDTYQGTLRNLVLQILDTHNAQVETEKEVYLGQFTVENANVYRAYQNYETSISRLSDLLETFGGYMMVRKRYDPTRNGIIDVGYVDVGYVDSGEQLIYFDWLDHFTDPCTQKIELTSNLLDVKKVQDASTIATVILPLGAKDEEGNRLTIESVNGGSKFIVADNASLAKYGYVVKAEIWDDVTVAANLKSKGQDYLTACLTPKTEISLTAVDLADAGYDVDSFRVGQMITVKAPQIGTEALQFECVKQKLNLLAPAQNKLELGEVRTGYISVRSGESSEQIMLDVVKRIEASQDVMQQAITAATALITGNQGGYVVLHDGDDDGYPDEILVMDTADIETSVKVWRWNKSGLGYSSHGYNGPYETAWTIDGAFNANFITAGTLSANLVRAGILQALNGNSYWNMETGDARFDGDIVARSLTLGTGVTVPYSKISSKPDLTVYVEKDGKIGATPSEGATGFIVSSAGLLQASNAIIYGTIYASAGKIGNFTLDNGSLLYGTIAEKKNGITLTSNYFALSYFQDQTRTYKVTISQDGIYWDFSKDTSSSFQAAGSINCGYTTSSTASLRTAYWQVRLGTDRKNIIVFYRSLGSHTNGFTSILGDLEVSGNVSWGGTKTRIVKTKDYAERALYSYETPSPTFGDIGEGVISEDGLCYIQIDPVFAQTVTLTQYQVFLQKYGAGDCWVRERKPGFFVVEGTPGMAFGWEIKAKQSDFDQLRFEQKGLYYTPPSSAYGAEAAQHIKDIYDERRITV